MSVLQSAELIDPKIKPGCLVRLKAGGPEMLVLSRVGVRTECELPDETNREYVSRPYFDARYLALMTDPKPHTPEPETAEDRIATQRKAKAMSDKCGND